MKGFFTRREIETKAAKQAPRSSRCLECGLYRTCKTPKMKPHGKGRLKAMIVAEAPGKNEDELGKQLHYRLGRAYEADGRTADALKIYGQLIQWDYNYRNGEVRKRLDALKAQK